MKPFKWVGIDFGGKSSQTTVLCYSNDQKTVYIQPKTKDIDQFLIYFIEENGFQRVYIDAPLSLPNGLYKGGENYSKRAVDQALGAMSPMYLGALTARAIKLKHQLEVKGIECIETYPAQLEIELWKTKTPKKNDLPLDRYESLQEKVSSTIMVPQNRHQYDALLAWYSGYRHINNHAKVYGDEEGYIIV